MNLRTLLPFLYLFILAQGSLYADTTVLVTATINQSNYPNKNLQQLKEIALKKAKLQAAKKIYGEIIIENTNMNDGKIVTNNVQDICGGIIHIQGEPKFKNGKKLGDIVVIITASASNAQVKAYNKSLLNLHLTHKENKSQKKQDFYGSWSGYIMSSTDGSTKVIITITSAGQSKIAFPTLNCGGDLVIKSKDIKYVTFKEFLNYGFDKCRNKDKVILVKENNNKLQYEQYSLSNQKIAHGVLYRER